MNIGRSSFELIMQELLNQKACMEEMQEENHELHSQLSELREGRGIFVEICGQRIALIGETIVAPQISVPEQDELAAPQTVNSVAEITVEAAPETPLPETNQVQVEEVEKQPETTYSFLEEALLDEFAAAVTSPMAIWTGPNTTTTPKPQPIAEDEKAALRRELMGSFLLE